MSKVISIAEKLGFDKSAPTVEEIIAMNDGVEESEDFPLSKYTQMWLNNMETEYPTRIADIVLNGELQNCIQIVENEIQALKGTLEENYRKDNPRPETYLETIQYENQLQMYIEEIILKDIVYKSK